MSAPTLLFLLEQLDTQGGVLITPQHEPHLGFTPKVMIEWLAMRYPITLDLRPGLTWTVDKTRWQSVNHGGALGFIGIYSAVDGSRMTLFITRYIPTER